ncbi:MAG: hypothetical protein K6B74_04910, partial [Ruminococcus sp.]|nr:hypothetical protein [Ruminococcus sp.]
VGGQEYCMVTKAVYAELLRFKAVEEGEDPAAVSPEKTPTVIISIRDFYNVKARKDEYREISRGEFNELMARKKEEELAASANAIKVKASVFAPYIDSDKEYVALEWKSYASLLRIKASEEYMVTPDSENSLTVRIRLRDFFPRVRLTVEYNDVSSELYEELLRYKRMTDPEYAVIEGDKVTIRVTEYYPENVGDQEYVDVSREVYYYLLDERMKEKSRERYEERFVYGSQADFVKLGEMEGIFEESAESVCIRNGLLNSVYKAMNKLKPELSRRYYMRKALGYSEDRIAKIEGISQSAASQSIAKADKLIRMILKNEGLLSM